MDRTRSVVTAGRFAQGMTFDEYVRYTATPENLAREAGWWLGRERKDLSGILRYWYAEARIGPAQTDAIRWLAAQPGGPAKIFVISEEWSSDCRRDVCILARLAEAGGLELRIFNRDGSRFATGPRADPDESPNADLMNAYLYEKDGQTFQSIPVAVILTRDFVELHRHIEKPALYIKHRDALVNAMQAPRPGETKAQTWARFMTDWRALQEGPFFPIWASATADEILSAVYERLLLAR